MSPERRGRLPPLKLVDLPDRPGLGGGPCAAGGSDRSLNETDWAILMARGQGGDAEAYRRLLERITPYVRSLVARHSLQTSDAEDAVQDVLLTIHAIRHTYDPSRPFGPWLVAIAHRRIVDWLRRRGRIRSRETAIEKKHETFPAPQANFDEESLDRRALRAAVDSLPPAQRQAVKLLKFQEMTLKEAASATGMTISSLKVTTHRALKSLRRILAGRNGDL